MKSNITVLTSTIPSRQVWFDMFKKSIDNQIQKPYTHLVRVNHDEKGCRYHESIVKLLPAVETEWIHITSDDDYYYPDYYKHCEEFTNKEDLGIISVEFNCSIYEPVPVQSLAHSVLIRDKHLTINPIVRVSAFKEVLATWLSTSIECYAKTWLDINEKYNAQIIETPLWSYSIHRGQESFYSAKEIKDDLQRSS